MNNVWTAHGVQFLRQSCGFLAIPGLEAALPPLRLPLRPPGARRAANRSHYPESSIAMSDEGNIITDLGLESPLPNGEDTAPSAGIISQYVKDLSVENPNSPESFQWQDPPQIDVQFNISARQLSDEVSEISLKIGIASKSEAGTAFIVDLTYAGLVGMRNLDEAQMHAFTYAEAPRVLFPFARHVVAEAVRDAGFPPLLLEPIDFNGLYLQQLSESQAAEAEVAAGVSTN